MSPSRVAAYAAFAVTIPSAVWRVLMVEGWLPGTDALRAAELATAGRGYVYALSIAQLFFGFLAVGLVRPWGERIAGIAVNRWLVFLLAATGALAVTGLFTVSMPMALLDGQRPDQGLVTGPALWLMSACYAPIVLWGPLLLVAAIGHLRRRRG